MLKLEPHVLAMLDCHKESLFLGIITVDGRVTLHVAAPYPIPDHATWLRMDSGLRPKYGFSLIAKQGRVLEIFRVSALNSSRNDGVLPMRQVEELKAALPVSEDLIVYGGDYH